MSLRPITIVGGGISGLSLGIDLQLQGLPVHLFEAGDYPRHRVCGEFLSGQGYRQLQEWGLAKSFLAAGAVEATHFKCYGPAGMSPVLRLPSPALCLSRYRMDDCMAEHFRELGGHLITRHRVHPADFEEKEGTIWAQGRLAQTRQKYPWIGYKCHLKDYPLAADLEMHFGRNGYVGLCRVEDGIINVCGLTRVAERESGMLGKGRWLPWALSSLHPSKHKNLQKAECLEDSLCYTAGLQYKARWFETTRTKAVIGDHRTLIPPLTGNGMSMAVESAHLATPFIQNYFAGDLQWEEVCQQVNRAMNQRFRKRLLVAGLLQRLILARHGEGIRNSLIKNMSAFHRYLYAWTR